jgi:hypothetical protein
MNTQGMLTATKDLRNRNSSSMYALSAEDAGSVDAVRKAVTEAYVAAGFPAHRGEQRAEDLTRQLRKLHQAMELVHYGTDALAGLMDNVNHELKQRRGDSIF